MSITRSVLPLVNTEMLPPLLPAGTIAALAIAVAVEEAFSVDTSGLFCPAGQVLKNPMTALGTAVKFSEYAWAEFGTLQELD